MFRKCHPLCLRLLALLTTSFLVAIPSNPKAFTIFGTGSDGEEIVAAIVALQGALSTVINRTNDILNACHKLKDFTNKGSTLDLLRDNLNTLNQINGDLEGIRFTATSVRAEYEQLFPKDQTAWNNMQYSDYDKYSLSWQNRINDSTQVALRNQARLASVQQNNDSAQKLLNESKTSTGDGARDLVVQLQTVNNLLALGSKQNNTLIQSLTESGRITTEMAAVSAGEKQMERARQQHRTDGYTNMGKPPVVLNRLP